MSAADTYLYYRARGWPGVLPLPHKQKFPPPSGTTGRSGVDLDDQALIKEGRRRPDGNVALRLPRGVLGIDVDAGYSGKRGDITIAKAIEVYGPLPPSWSTTARGQGQPSRISYYQCSPEIEFAGQLEVGDTGDVELIQPHHRFAVVAPSIHPDTGQRYRWYRPDGCPLGDGEDVPRPDELPWLPGAWQNALGGPVKEALPTATDEQVRDLTARLDVTDDMCPAMQKLLTEKFVKPVVGSRHDHTRNHVLRLLRLGERGHRGAASAVESLRAWFLAAVGDDRDAEFQRFIDGGLSVVAREPTPESWRRCCPRKIRRPL